MNHRLPAEAFEEYLSGSPNRDRTIAQLASHFGCSDSTARKKCQALVEDEQSSVALLIYRRYVEPKKGRPFFRFMGGYCAVDPRAVDDEFHKRMEETRIWARDLSYSVKKLVWTSFNKAPNAILIKTHAAWRHRIHTPPPRALPSEPDYESFFQFG